MTEFEDKIKKYLYEANKKHFKTKSAKLSSAYYGDILALLSLIKTNELDIDVDSILKYSKEDFDIEKVEKKYDEYIINNYYKCFETNNKISDLGIYFDNYYGEGYFKKHKVSINLDDCVKLCHDFFEFYDKDVLDYYLHMLDNHDIYSGVLNEDPSIVGCAYSLTNQKDPLVVTQYVNNIRLVNTVIHEVIHSYLEHFNNDLSFETSSQKTANNLDEVYSRFIEQVFALYLKEINFNQNEIDALTLSCDNTLIEVLYDYNYILKNYSLEDILNNDELFYSFMTNEVYSYGGVMGYHYFDEYLKNEDRCKDNITKMSLDSKKYDRKYLLNNYGLKEKNLGKSRVLKKHLKEHFKY